MLKGLRTRMHYHLQAIKSSLTNLRLKPFMAIMTAVVIGITLTLPTLFFVISGNLRQLSADWKQGSHIFLYLKMPITAKEESALYKRVMNTPGVGAATLRSKEEGLALLQQQEGMQDIMQFLPENPLPTVIDVIPAFNMNTKEKLNKLYQTLQADPNVEQAKFDLEWVGRFYFVLDVVYKMAFALILLLGLAVLLIIGNTLRLAVQTRHEEINVLNLIGASREFIHRPFLYLGMFYGLFGALFALIFVNTMLYFAAHLIKTFTETYQVNFVLQGLSFKQTLELILFSVTLSWLGAKLSTQSTYKAMLF